MNKLYIFIFILCFNTVAHSQQSWQVEAVGNPIPLTPVSSYSGWTNQGILSYTGTAVVDTANPSNNLYSSGSGNILFTNNPGTYMEISGFPGYPDVATLDIQFNVHGYDLSNPTVLNDLILSVSIDSGSTWSTLPCSRFYLPQFYPPTPWDVFYANIPTMFYNPTPYPYDDDYTYLNMNKLFVRFTQTSATNIYRVDDLYVSGIALLNLKIKDFSAVAQDGKVSINWRAISNSSSDRFILEKSKNGVGG